MPAFDDAIVFEDAFSVHLASRLPREVLKRRLGELSRGVSPDARDMLDLIAGSKLPSEMPSRIVRRVNQLLNSAGKDPLTPAESE
jgi:hypothetical protein